MCDIVHERKGIAPDAAPRLGPILRNLRPLLVEPPERLRLVQAGRRLGRGTVPHPAAPGGRALNREAPPLNGEGLSDRLIMGNCASAAVVEECAKARRDLPKPSTLKEPENRAEAQAGASGNCAHQLFSAPEH
jgi:hypothetical protein